MDMRPDGKLAAMFNRDPLPRSDDIFIKLLHPTEGKVFGIRAHRDQ